MCAQTDLQGSRYLEGQAAHTSGGTALASGSMRAGTIVASNYSAMAHVVGESFLRHHPTSTFTVLIVDDGPCSFPDGIRVIRLADLDLEPADIDVMRSIYDVMEFSTSVKGSFLRTLLNEPGEDLIACYLDPDIVVYAPIR